jgi:hypothetical protein
MAKSGTQASSSCMKLGRLRKKNFQEHQIWAMDFPPERGTGTTSHQTAVAPFNAIRVPEMSLPCVIRLSTPSYDIGGGCSPFCPARVQQKVTGLIVFRESGASCGTPIVPSALVSSHWRVGDFCARKSKHASATWRNCPVTIADLRGICVLRGLDSVLLARPQSSFTSSNGFLAREGHFPSTAQIGN